MQNARKEGRKRLWGIADQDGGYTSLGGGTVTHRTKYDCNNAFKYIISVSCNTSTKA